MRKIILALLVLLVVFSAGCLNGDDNPTDPESPYIGGSNGLGLSFEATAPLAEFTQDDEVDVRLKVINRGEQEILENTAKVKLYGISPTEFNTLSFDYFNVEPSLFPAEKEIFDVGGQAVVDMGKINYNGLISSGYIERDIYAKICYPYKTKANVEACITSQRIEQSGSANICSYQGEKIKEGFVSSGPVQITTFTEEPRGVDEIIFRVGFQNKRYVDNNKGQVFSRDANCEDMEGSFGSVQNDGKIFVKILPENVLCSFSNGQYSEGFLTLNRGEEKVLVCTMQVEGDSEYIQGLDIEVDYNYIDSTTTKIKILSNQ
jgi:hypothetical protein